MITFRKVTLTDLPLLNAWLQEPHVKEFWDNSDQQYNNMYNYLKGIKDGPDYYIGFMTIDPFCLLLTTYECIEDTLDQYRPYLSNDWKTYTLDFMIGNKAYLGKGYASTTLHEFCLYLNKQDPKTTRFVIDPAETNPKAIHVYEKAGFHKVNTYTPQEGEFAGKVHYVMIKDL